VSATGIPGRNAAATDPRARRARRDADRAQDLRVISRPDPIAPRPFVLPAVVLGIGLGGLLDGIVLHQVLQWHHMASAVDPPTTVEALHRNTLADGLFHAVAWVATLAGVLLLWRAFGLARGRPSWGVLVGGLLVGFASFNLVEGVVDHLILGIHHVREGPDAALYDAAFLIGSALVFVIGSAVLRRGIAGRPPAVRVQRHARTERGGG
jgi:uncharacterized membrane protein